MLRASLRVVMLIVATAVTAGTIACSGADTPAGPSDDSSSGTGTGNSAAAGSGQLTIGITDSPFSEAEALLVSFSEMSVHRSGSGWETLPFAGGAAGRTCDLKKLQGPTDVLGVGTLPAGHYTQIRLTVESAALFFDNASAGGACAAQIANPAGLSASVNVPSGTVKLNRQFTVASASATTILLDFDGDRSIHQTDGGNGNGGNGNGNGRGRGNGGPNSGSETEETGGSYTMHPVIAVVSVQ